MIARSAQSPRQSIFRNPLAHRPTLLSDCVCSEKKPRRATFGAGPRRIDRGPDKKGPPTSGGPGVGLNPIHSNFYTQLIVLTQYIDRYRCNAHLKGRPSRPDRHASAGLCFVFLRAICAKLRYGKALLC